MLHMARAEVTWVQSRFAGMDVEIPDDDATGDDTLAQAIGC
jgi:hypothetical protein